ncbi:MAG: hypothetical protein EZS28_028848, partial [Streblomastix strix]
VVCAGGGVRSIADIQSASYSKSEDDALLLLKADKSTTYTKTEDDALLLLKADKIQLIDSYTKGETDNLLNNKANTGVSYTKGEDDALLLLKADKTQLIDSYNKGETNNLLNNKADTGVSYTKGEDDALLLLKADKTQLIDSYTKGETDNLLNNKANTGVSYSKGEDDALLLLKANQSTTYTKIETDQLISQVDVGDVDLTDYYNKTKTDELLSEKADTIELSNYMTLGTSQTITANKTFNNACRFISSIDGLSTVTGSSFVKSGADDTVVLLGAGGTKPLSEFAGTPTNLSNYYTKTQTFSQTEANNKFVRLEGSVQQTITGRLKYVSPFDYPDETQDPVANTYLTMSEVDAKLTNVVTTNTTQSITGAKTFNANVTATGFAKTGKDDTSVLLAGGGDKLISSFGGVQVEDITSSVVNLHSNITFNYLKLVRIGTFYTLMMEIIPKTQIAISTQTTICTVGSISNTITPPTPPSTTYPISLATKRKTLTCAYSYRDFKISTDSTEAWGINDDVDEALLDVAGLSDFPELYAYIRERYQEPLPPAQRVPIGEQTLQKQVKDNDDILFSTNEVFVPPVSNAATKLDLSSQLERSSFLASSGSDPQLIVYNDRVTLTVSYETTGLFPNGYLFKSYPEEARPKAGDKVIALVGTDSTNKNSIFCYIDQNGPFIISTSQIPSKTALVINVTYYKKYESSKKINYDANNDGRVDIMDTWHVNGKGTFETLSHVYETVKKIN